MSEDSIVMVSVAAKVLSTVNAPYGAGLSAAELAGKITNPPSAEAFDPCAFAFFSEVSPGLQSAFIREMGVELAQVVRVAQKFSEAAGYPLPLNASAP